MNRRELIATVSALALIPSTSLAMGIREYTPGVVQEELDAGNTVFVDFYTTWCTTCRVQHRVIGALKSENPAYEQAISFVQVDWDVYSRSKLSRRLKISTAVYVGGAEGRSRAWACRGGHQHRVDQGAFGHRACGCDGLSAGSSQVVFAALIDHAGDRKAGARLHPRVILCNRAIRPPDGKPVDRQPRETGGGKNSRPENNPTPPHSPDRPALWPSG